MYTPPGCKSFNHSHFIRFNHPNRSAFVMAKELQTLPVTLLSGFLGSGKTTLLKHILGNKADLKVAVIVNDMAELNIDAELIKHSHLVQAEEKLVQLQNGCICCTLREDLLREVSSLVSQGAFDYIVIESTGISEPQQVAETFDMDHSTEQGLSLKGRARLDNCVTVLDAAELFLNLDSIKSLREHDQAATEEDDRNIAELLLDQIEFADVILLNKQDLVPDCKTQKAILEAIKTLNPLAQVKFTTKCKVPMTDILNTGNFDMEKAATAPGWLHSLRSSQPVASESVEYGITSFVYRARKPFHPQKLYDFVQQNFVLQEQEVYEDMEVEGDALQESTTSSAGHPHVIEPVDFQKRSNLRTATYGKIFRSKGFVWIGRRDDMMGEWSSAGNMLQLNAGSPWFAAMPQEAWPDVEVAEVMQDFVEPHGDRRQEIVFIGQDLNNNAISSALDGCLCRESELRESKQLRDPFKEWPDLDIMEVEVTDSSEDSQDYDASEIDE